MKFTRKLLLPLLIVLVSFISVADLIYRLGHPITFDGHIHMTTMNQYAQSLFDLEFPVTWANNFANFGHPLSNIAHQLPAYSGALLILLGLPTEVSYIFLIVLSVILSSFLFYKFFRKFSSQTLSFTATVLSVFFPYRALNIYTRGGLPELMATIFLPLLLLGVWNLRQQKYLRASLLIYFGILLTALTHPMMLLVFSIPVGTYFFYCFTKYNKSIKEVLIIATSSISLGLLSASYYLVPLFLEMKYFYQSTVDQVIVNDSFLTLKQLYNPNWFYTLTHPGPRGNYIKFGIIEFIILLLSILLIFISNYLLNNKNKYINFKEIKPLIFWSGLTVFLILIMSPVSELIYKLPFLYQIQYPWRFLTAVQITLPLVFIFLVKSIKTINNNYFLLFFIGLVLFLRVPQFYGKNYIVQPESDYYYNQANLHSTNFNTLWSDNPLNYNKKIVQAEIIEGHGEFKIIEEKNASRIYKSSSEGELRLIDYTFYFPGWEVIVDGVPIEFEYQDINYRGLITYWVPSGDHKIEVIYKYSKVRLLGLSMTIFSLLFATVFFYQVRKHNQKTKSNK
jgi:hypothetical protein